MSEQDTTTPAASWCGPVPSKWAPAMLQLLADRHPGIFRDLMLFASIGVDADQLTQSGRRRGANGS